MTTSYGDAPDRSNFEIAYGAFRKVVQVAAKDAATQCKTMGNFNVAWELRNDIESGAYLRDTYAALIREDVRHAIGRLLESVKLIPDDVLSATSSATENITAMEHSSWNEVRTAAKRFLEVEASTSR